VNARYRRIEPLDVLIDDGESLVLLPPDRVVRLSPIATVLFEETAHPTPLDSLTKLIEATFGPPEGTTTSAALEPVLADLVESGVLERDTDD